MINQHHNIHHKRNIDNLVSFVVFRTFATSGFDSITTRELRTFRALYNAREFLNTLQPNGNPHISTTVSVTNTPGLETLRTFFVPSSVTG